MSNSSSEFQSLWENGSEQQEGWKQLLRDCNHSTSTNTRGTEKVKTTTSCDSSKRRNLPPIAKSDMYKTRMCRNYMETGRCKYGRVCQFAHGMKELRKYSLCVCLDHVEQRQQYTLLRGHFTTVLLTGMTALTEDEDISDAIMLKPLPLVVRRASQSASTNTSSSDPSTLFVDILLPVCPRAYLEDATIR